jgi:hypothetical protein
MDIQNIRWEHYPRVAAHSAARSFIERLILKGKRPKTVDAYARAVEDLLTYFSEVAPNGPLKPMRLIWIATSPISNSVDQRNEAEAG